MHGMIDFTKSLKSEGSCKVVREIKGGLSWNLNQKILTRFHLFIAHYL